MTATFLKKVFMGRNSNLRRTLCLLPIWAIFTLVCFGQTTGILDPARVDSSWSTAGAGVIPNRTTISATLSTGASFASINSAIAACGNNQVVKLNAGTYTGSGQIIFNNHSNCTLRGNSPNDTFIVYTGVGSCNGLGAGMCITNGDSNDQTSPGNQASWTTNFSQGTSPIIINSFTSGAITNLHIGSLLIMDQTDDASDPGNNIYICSVAGSGKCAQQGSVNSANNGRGQLQVVTVTSITGSGPWTVGISPGVKAPNWTSGRSPQVYFSGTLPVTGDGIENLTLDWRGSCSSGCPQRLGIEFVNATNSWVKNVRSLNATNGVTEQVMFYQSSHITVRDNYFYGGNPSQEDYGVDCGWTSSDGLVENNIFEHIASPEVGQGCSGGVYGYNYFFDDYFCTFGSVACQTGAGQSNFQQLSAHHSVGDYMTLFEGSEGVGYTADNIHGSSFMQTFFRNRYSGFDLGGGGVKSANTWAINLYSTSRYYNFVNNVLGTSGYHGSYVTIPTSSGDCGTGAGNSSIYTFGFSAGATSFACIGGFTLANDTATQTQSNIEINNYDTFNAAVMNCTGVATPVAGCPNDQRAASAAVYPGLSSPSLTMPNSFYLPSKPAFWDLQTPLVTPPWPATGGDITGGNIPNTGGHANHIPASVAFASLTPDTGSGINTTKGTITTCTESGTTATCGISAMPAYFEVGYYISVQGNSVSGYNFTGARPLTATGTNTFSYTADSSGLGSGSGGTAYSAPVMLFDASTLYYGSASSAVTSSSILNGVSLSNGITIH